jgi:ribosome-binding factor A
MASQTRQFKVADLLQKIIADLLLRDLKDPRVPLVSVASVEVSRDLSFAKVFISMFGANLGEEDLSKSVLEKLNLAKGFVRHTIAKQASLRIVPELAFVLDRTLERGHELSSLIDAAVHSKNPENPENPEDAKT